MDEDASHIALEVTCLAPNIKKGSCWCFGLFYFLSKEIWKKNS